MRTFKSNGWRGESYRHYLAAKGVRTTSPVAVKKYFATDLASPYQDESPIDSSVFSRSRKGNRVDTQNIQRLHAKGWKDVQIVENASSLKSQGVLSEMDEMILRNKLETKKSAVPEGPPDELTSSVPESQLPTFDLPMGGGQRVVSAPQVNLDNLEDELPDRAITSNSSIFSDDSEKSEGVPAGLRRAMSAPVATPGAPEVPDYDLKT